MAPSFDLFYLISSNYFKIKEKQPLSYFKIDRADRLTVQTKRNYSQMHVFFVTRLIVHRNLGYSKCKYKVGIYKYNYRGRNGGIVK